MYSNPPIHGASIVAVILRDRNLFNEWTLELKAMADRIISMRKQLFEALRARGKVLCDCIYIIGKQQITLLKVTLRLM